MELPVKEGGRDEKEMKEGKFVGWDRTRAWGGWGFSRGGNH
jgi:hypothetical protein